MKPASLRELKLELENKSKAELTEICLQLVRFKLETKELLTYLLMESKDEDAYIEGVKMEMDTLIDHVSQTSNYYINKSARKILRMVKKQARYSKKKSTEFELIRYYCEQVLTRIQPNGNKALMAIVTRQIEYLRKSISTMHEDLQYDYNQELDKLQDFR